jgi:hypothetical protein
MTASEMRKAESEKRRNGALAMPGHFSFFALRLSFAVLLVAAAGCASGKHGATTRPSTTAERQDAALRDPFGYSPNIDENRSDMDSDWGRYDREGMRKDLDHVLNP